MEVSQFQQIIKSKVDANTWVDSLNKFLPMYGITGTKQVAMFMAQCGHESGDFNFYNENLNYSAEGLHATFVKYFPTLESAVPYARNQPKIGNKVYANRMGNGDEASGEGYKFHGRGLIQITGKNNYVAFATKLQMTIDQTVGYLQTKDGAVESACWFWQVHTLNPLCDTDNVVAVTQKINGGQNGIADRQTRYNAALNVLS